MASRVDTEAEITYYREEITYDGETHTHTHTHSHPCIGDLNSESPCECCNHIHGQSLQRLHPDDCKICIKTPHGFHNSSKFPLIRHRMLQTLTKKRRDKSKTGIDEINVVMSNDEAKAAVRKSINVLPDEPSGSKFGMADVDTLVKIIEGTHISLDPKKAAKRARQKEKKIQEKLEEEMRVQEEERRLKEEEERKKREEEERQAEAIRIAEELKRLSRKAKKKNRKKRQTEETSMDDPSVQQKVLLNSSMPGFETKLAKAAAAGTSISNAVISGFSGSRDQNGPQSLQSLANSNPEMVTIRRHPSQPDSVVTISHKGKSGEDFLYFLVNGQIFRNDGLPPNFDPEVVANRNKEEKQSTGDGKDKKKKRKCKLVSATQGTPTKSHDVEDQIDVKHSPAIRSLDKNVAMKPGDVDLSKLKLPPGITITKVTSSVDGKRSEKSNSSSSTPTLTVEPVTPLKSQMNGVKNEVDYKKPTAKVHEEVYFNNSSFDDTIFGTPEEQFEEVVSSKNRRKRNKAAAKSTVADHTEDSYRLSAHGKSAVKLGRHSTLSESTRDMSPNRPSDVGKSIQLTTDRLKPSGVLKAQTFDMPPANSRLGSRRNTGKTTFIHPSHVGAKMYRGIPRLNRNPAATLGGSRRNIGYNDQNHLELENRTSPNLPAATNCSSFPDFQLQHRFECQESAFNREELLTDARSSSSCSASDITPAYSNVNLREQGTNDMERFTVNHLRGVTKDWNIWGTAECTDTPSSNVMVEPPKHPQCDPSVSYNFQELMRVKSAKSPIQRPSPATLEAPRVVNGNSSFYNTQRSYLNHHQTLGSQPGTVDYDYDDCYKKYPLPAVLPDVRPLLLPSSMRDYRMTSQYPIPARTGGYCTMESHRSSPINQSLDCGWTDQYSGVRKQEHAFNQVDFNEYRDIGNGWGTNMNSCYTRNNNSNRAPPATQPIGTRDYNAFSNYMPKMAETIIKETSNSYGTSSNNFDADRIKMLWPEHHPDYTNRGAHH